MMSFWYFFMVTVNAQGFLVECRLPLFLSWVMYMISMPGVSNFPARNMPAKSLHICNPVNNAITRSIPTSKYSTHGVIMGIGDAHFVVFEGSVDPALSMVLTRVII